MGWGRLAGKVRRRTPLLEGSCRHKTSSFGPPVEDEHLYHTGDALDSVAEETGQTVPKNAMHRPMHRPSASSVIIGARNEEQLRQNLGAVEWTLTPEEIAKSTLPRLGSMR